MSKKPNNMLSMLLRKEGGDKNGKLVYLNKADEKIYRLFVDSLLDGQIAEVFMDAQPDDGSLAQLAKIHKCIREIAMETGTSVEDMKLIIKKKAGFCIKKEIDGEMIMYCKSFSKCSKEELSLVIETIISVGDLVGCNLR
jgi:hypothetical protein